MNNENKSMNNERSSKKPKSKIEVVQKIKWPKEKEKTKG